ncbi:MULTISPECIES: AraC family transcriptional regulator [unclassified Cupriavidus]|uniref:AraC family transcriptional regulator n=1 Tax=Cupriavidus sp. H19C3 TaxID=3241603 RepID=UPI003BF77404
MTASSWIDLRHDAQTGIESLHAHFEGHAYDPHWHDSYLIGYTQQGIQQFHCRRSVHSSTPGQVFMLEPGEIHDGRAVAPDGFTYASLMLDPQWIERELRAVFAEAPEHCLPGFASTLQRDPRLTAAVVQAHRAAHEPSSRMDRQSAFDTLLIRLTAHLQWRQRTTGDPRLPLAAARARDYLHDHLGDDVGLDDLAAAAGVDRFRLTRAFKAAFGLAPHAYLVQMRLAHARRLLAAGVTPVDTAAALGFADQSHLGRWFRRAYGLTPAAYRQRCSNVPDIG